MLAALTRLSCGSKTADLRIECSSSTGVLWRVRVVGAIEKRDSAVHVHDPHLVDLARTLVVAGRVFAGNAGFGTQDGDLRRTRHNS